MSALIPNDGGQSNPHPESQTTIKLPERPPAESKPPKPSVLKFAISLVIAGTADCLDFLLPLLSIPIGVGTAISLLALWGWRWEILVVLVPEAIPGLSFCPTWIALVVYMGIKGFLGGGEPRNQVGRT